MTFDDPCVVDRIKLETALDADPRLPLGCIIIHQQNIIAGSDHISGLIFVWSFVSDSRIIFKPIKTLKGHQANIVALQDLSSCFASCSKDGTLRLWRDFNCIAIIDKCHGIDKYPTSLACYYPSDQSTPILYSGGTDGLIISYDITKGRASNVVGGHTGWILCLAAKSDGPFLFSGSTDCTVKLWDSVTLQFLHSFEGHTESIYSISAFENYLVSGDRSGEIRLYDMFTSDCLNVFKDNYMINSLQIYRRDGRIRVLSMGHGNYLCEWDTFSQEYNCINKFHFGTIRSSMNYKDWIFTAARDGAIGVWRLEKDDTIESSLELFNENSGESFPTLDLFTRNDWSAVRKAFQELKKVNCKQKNEIFSLRAEVFNLKFNQGSRAGPKSSISESKHVLECIHDMLDSHLKNSSHQLVKSAMLLEEMRIVLRDDEEDEINQVKTKNESSKYQEINGSQLDQISSEETTIVMNNEIYESIPVVLSASSCSEFSSSFGSVLSDDLAAYYGSKSYREDDYFPNLEALDLSSLMPEIWDSGVDSSEDESLHRIAKHTTLEDNPWSIQQI